MNEMVRWGRICNCRRRVRGRIRVYFGAIFLSGDARQSDTIHPKGNKKGKLGERGKCECVRERDRERERERESCVAAIARPGQRSRGTSPLTPPSGAIATTATTTALTSATHHHNLSPPPAATAITPPRSSSLTNTTNNINPPPPCPH